MKPGDIVYYIGPHVVDGVADDEAAGGCVHDSQPVEKTALDWAETIERHPDNLHEKVMIDDVETLVPIGIRKRIQVPRRYFHCDPPRVVPASEKCNVCGREPDQLYGGEAMIVAISDPIETGTARNVVLCFKQKRLGLHSCNGLVREGHGRWTTLDRIVTPERWAELKAKRDESEAQKQAAIAGMSAYLGGA